jgi:uncharacterized repeat protein (TIGR02543 family)
MKIKKKINYTLNGGHWNPKDEVKEAFYKDMYHFINERFDTELKDISLQEFVTLEPYIIGNLVGKYFLKEEVGGTFETQPSDCFVGYCYQNKKYMKLIPHLIEFFAYWREIENCSEKNATDFFANGWAALVDTAKFFKYTSIEDLMKSPEAPQVRDERILSRLQSCPEQVNAPFEVDPKKNLPIPKPRRTGYEFLGWFEKSDFNGAIVSSIYHGIKTDITLYANWGTHTYFHSNDGYITFDDLYDDFLKDFSNIVGYQVTKDKAREMPHGWMTHFIKASFNGYLDQFFANQIYYDKWIWLINYIKSLYSNNAEMMSRLTFEQGKFGLEAQARWELNSLFAGRFHLVWPKTKDYSGAGIKEKLADSTNFRIQKVSYPVGEVASIPEFSRVGYSFSGWYETPDCSGKKITQINDDRYAAKTLYAKWIKV